MLTAPEPHTAFDATRRDAPRLELLPALSRELPSPGALLARPARAPSRPTPAEEDDFDSMWEDGMAPSW
jgi:hypothetical protein